MVGWYIWCLNVQVYYVAVKCSWQMVGARNILHGCCKMTSYSKKSGILLPTAGGRSINSVIPVRYGNIRELHNMMQNNDSNSISISIYWCSGWWQKIGIHNLADKVLIQNCACDNAILHIPSLQWVHVYSNRVACLEKRNSFQDANVSLIQFVKHLWLPEYH